MPLPAPTSFERRVTIASLAILTTLVVAGCGREPTSGAAGAAPGLASLSLQLGPLFQTSGTATVRDSITAARFTVTRTSPSPVQVIANVVEDFSKVQGDSSGKGPDSLTVSFPLQGDNAEYAVMVKAVDFQGDTLYQLGPLQFKASQIDDKGTVHVTANQSDVRYVGPGSEATRVVASSHVVNLISGQSVQLSATAYGPSGAVLPRALFQWGNITNLGVAFTDGRGLIFSGGKRGTELIGVAIVSALLPTDTVRVNVTLPPSQIQLVSGGGQSGLPGTQLANPIVVKVLAVDGLPVSGATVQFSPNNGGSASPATVTSASDGTAQTRWTLGSNVGAQTLNATVPGFPGSLPVQAQATQAALTLVSGNNQTGPAGQTLADPIVVQVLSGSTPVAGTSVTFTVISGGGSVSPVSIATDASGRAQTRWTLGSTGVQSLSVAAANTIPASVAVSANLSPAVLTLVSGNSQTGNAGAALANPIVVQVLNGTLPVSGTNVVFTVTSGGGSVSPSSIATDANGRAQTSWTLGSTAGAQTMSVTAAGASGSIAVTATATVATQVSFISILPSAITTSQSATITVQVSTSGANPQAVSGAAVSFTSSGSGNAFSSVTATTGANGQATTVFTSTVPETKTITVTSASGTSSAQMTLLVVAPTTATQLVKVSGDNQSVHWGTNFGLPIVVKALDAAGNPVQGALIDWGTTTGNVRRATDANGLSSFQYFLPNDPVNYPTGVSLTIRVPLVGTTAFVIFTYFAGP